VLVIFLTAASGPAGWSFPEAIGTFNPGATMRISPGVMLLQIGLAACGGSRSEEAKEESTRVSTDTLIETRQVADTTIVRTDSTIAADTAIKADTTVSADTIITADTMVSSDTIKAGD
jgi:hypothetical protein